MKKRVSEKKLLRKTLLSYFITFTVLPSILVGLASFLISFSVLKKHSVSSSRAIVERVANDINGLLTKAETISNLMSEDLLIQKTLRSDLSSNRDRYLKDLEISYNLMNRFKYDVDIFGVNIFGINRGKYSSGFRTVKKIDMRKEEWFWNIIGSDGPVWFTDYTDSLAVISVYEDLIAVGSRVLDKGTGKATGIVLTEIDKALIEEKMNISLGKKGYFRLYDRSGLIISQTCECPDENGQFVSLENKKRDPRFSDEKINVYTGEHLVFTADIPVNDWMILGSVPIQQITGHSLIIAFITILVIGFVSLACIFFAIKLSRDIVTPITSLTLLMEQVESGDLTVRFTEEPGNEIQRLGDNFNYMIERIQNLLEENNNKQKILRKTELKALQSQINPHFLYNTLDSIIWLLRKDNKDKAISMVVALTKYFRNSISKGKEIITLKDEIEHIENYLIIQNIRYEGLFSYDIFMSEEISGFKTLKVLLQPIVENALYHGIKTMRQEGYISIIVLDEDTHLTIKIYDNGAGLSPVQTALFNNSSGINNNPGSMSRKGYGISNVNERIKLFFGQEYGLHYDSEVGKGTTVRLTLPKYTDETYD